MTAAPPSASGADRPTVSIQTLGCKVNAFESEYIYHRLQAADYARSDDTIADVCIVNTCTVTREADRQSRQAVRRAVRENPQATIVVTGCYAEMNPEECARIEGVDLVVPGSRKLEMPRYIKNFQTDGLGPNARLPVRATQSHPLPSEPIAAFQERSRAFVQVQQGCDNGCTFCIIHQARGPSRSVLPTAISRQVGLHIESGFREIVLCGIDLGQYGTDLPVHHSHPLTLAKLTRELALRFPHCRFRLSSIDPAHLTAELISTIAERPNVCPHIHLSLQSGSAVILKRMKRRYAPEDVYRAVSQLRGARPELVLSADVMAGFPTESEENFADTCKMIHDLEIAYPHVFAYSPRPGTPAARIPKQVRPAERKARAKKLRELGETVRLRMLRRFAGQRCEVLFENYLEDLGMTRARMSNFIPVYLSGKAHIPQDLAWVQTMRVHQDGLLGVIPE